MKKYREWIGVLCIALIVSTLNLLHVFYWAFKTPKDTIFIGISHWYEDYFFYLSQLTQGAMGSWNLVNKYTLEHVPIGFNWLVNLLLGKVAAVLPFPVWTIYDASIFVFSIVYVLLMYKILIEVFPSDKKKRFGALLIALFSTNLLSLKFTPITYFYAYTAAWNRFGGVSHQIVQNILSLTAIYLYAKTLEKGHHYLRFALLTALTLSALFTVSTFYVVTDLIVFGVAVLFVYRNKQNFLVLIILAIPIAILSYFQWQLIQNPFWQFVREWEAARTPVSFTTFLLSAGTILLLLPFGIRRYLKTASPIRIVGAVFAFIPIALYFLGFAALTQTPSFRLLQPTAYVFFGAIAIEGIWTKKNWVFYSILVVYLALQLPGLYRELNSRIQEYYLNSHLNFIDGDVYDGLLFLKRQSHDKNVLAVHTLESLVPVMSGQSVYEGHATLTIDYKAKIDKTLAFYTKAMTPQEARAFLTANTIGYVLWEKRFGDKQELLNYYPFLNVLYENPKLIVFKPVL